MAGRRMPEPSPPEGRERASTSVVGGLLSSHEKRYNDASPQRNAHRAALGPAASSARREEEGILRTRGMATTNNDAMRRGSAQPLALHQGCAGWPSRVATRPW